MPKTYKAYSRKKAIFLRTEHKLYRCTFNLKRGGANERYRRNMRVGKVTWVQR